MGDRWGKGVTERRTSGAQGRGALFDAGCSEPGLAGTQVGTAPGQSQAQLPSPAMAMQPLLARPQVPPAHMVVVLPAPLWPRKEVICPS